jgi:hypothetical protein
MATKKKDTKKSVLRGVVMGDLEGVVDKIYYSDDGMKTVDIRNGNKGLVVTTYDKDATAKRFFLSVDTIKDFVLANIE